MQRFSGESFSQDHQSRLNQYLQEENYSESKPQVSVFKANQTKLFITSPASQTAVPGMKPTVLLTVNSLKPHAHLLMGW